MTFLTNEMKHYCMAKKLFTIIERYKNQFFNFVTMLDDAEKYKFYLDYRFWIALTVSIKLYGIWHPPIESWHTWRQVNVLMVARNFMDDPNIFLPKIDSNGPFSGITGMEFPLYNYLIYLCTKAFGESYIYGRLINLIISTFGVYYFYKVCQKVVSDQQALVALLILSFSEWFMYSRKIMPDTISLSLTIIALFYAIGFLQKKAQTKSIILYTLFGTLGGLVKLPALVILSPLAYWFFTDKKADLRSKLIFLGASTLVLLPSMFWYFYWFQYLTETYGLVYYFMGDSLSGGLNQIIGNFPATLRRFYYSSLGYSGFLLLLIGLYFFWTQKTAIKTWTFILVSLVLVAFIIKSGFAFHHHDYYILPIVPFLSFIASYTIQLNKKYVFGLITIFIVEGILLQMKDFSPKESHVSYLQYESKLDEIGLSKEDKIITNSGINPTKLYFFNREGWSLENNSLYNSDTLKSAIKHGAKYAVILKHKETENQFQHFGFKKIGSNEYFNVFQLDSTTIKTSNYLKRIKK